MPRFSVNCSFFGQSFSLRHYPPIHQPLKGVSICTKYKTNEALSAELVMIIISSSPSRIIVLSKTVRYIMENLKKKSERKEGSFRENRKKGSILQSNAINKKGA